jgi:lipopolysaccharide assembly outer membrane protein LptD (OstA)
MERAFAITGVVLSTFVLVALGQGREPIRQGSITFEANSISKTGHVMHLSGAVTIVTDTVVIHTDKTADFNTDTQEVQATGNVTIKLKH